MKTTHPLSTTEKAPTEGKSAPTETVMEIIRKIDPTFPIEQLIALAGGKAWYIPVDRRDFMLLRQQIKADPCRDWKVLMRRYQVSRGFIYSVWSRAL
jgi:Mor family transcriptional regulator